MSTFCIAIGGIFAALGVGELCGYVEPDEGGPITAILFGGTFMIVGFFLLKSRIVVFDVKSKSVTIQDKAVYQIFKTAKVINKYSYEDIDGFMLSRKHSSSSDGSSTTFGIKMTLENADSIDISSYYSNTNEGKRLEIIDKLNDHLNKFKAIH